MAITYPTIGALKSRPEVRRHPANPILSTKDVPYPTSFAYNAGIIKHEGRYVMVFRHEHASQEGPSTTIKWHARQLGLAFSKDGIKWDVDPNPLQLMVPFPPYSPRPAYDPRLTVIDGQPHMCFAVDSPHGTLGGIARTDDFRNFEVISLTTPDNRNMVLFPEKIGGHYYRLERPFPVYSRWGHPLAHFDIWLSESPDLEFWGRSHCVLNVDQVPYANDKLGPGAPPIKTPKGWLVFFHTVDVDPARGKNGWEATWNKRYCGGVMLLDLENPRKVIGMCREPLLAPEAPYEISGGLRDNVIFPGGAILEDSGEVKIYYGSADTVECLATAHVDELIAMCEPLS